MSRELKAGAAILLVVALVIALHYIGALRPLEAWLSRVVLGASGTIYQIGAPGDESTNQLPQHDAERITILEQENNELRAALNFLITNGYTHTGALVSRVVGKTIDPSGTTLFLDRGSADGIDIQDPAIVGEGILVGKIVALEVHSATLRLLNDPESKVAASILNEEKSIGLVEGGFGVSILMNNIPQHEHITVGDTVFTSGLEPTVPRGLIIGTVESIEQVAYEPFQRAVLRPSIDLSKIYQVSVITGKQ